MSKTVDQKQYTGILKNQIVVGLSLCTWLKEKSRILLLSVILIGRIFQSYSGLVIWMVEPLGICAAKFLHTRCPS